MYVGPEDTTSITNFDWRGRYARHEGETHEQHAERLRLCTTPRGWLVELPPPKAHESEKKA